ncbi:TPA: NAD-dependent epimerase/dehydratase family protein [Candidatus Woesearchaeota archaeon]|nr:NAD-dependent epimerase/dehydratase family protein [Candidatus Woesearchaeota archaeon]
MTKVLITGAAGLLGANFSRYLVECGYRVVGIDNLSGGMVGSVDPRIDFYPVDLADERVINNIFEIEKPDYVYHFAAYAAEGLSPFIRRFNYQNNIICSINVINACVNNAVKKIIFTSSMAVYGTGDPPYRESQSPSPEDPYGIAKYAVEMDLKLAYEQFGLEYTILRPHNVIGVYQNIWDRYRNVIGIWIRQVMGGDPITIYGDGTQVRAFSDIKFYMEPFLKVMDDHNGEVFNIGADRFYSINEAAGVVQKVGRELGYSSERVHLEARNEVHTAYCDHEKAKELLGFEDNTDFETMVQKMFRWASTLNPRVVEYQEYEIEKGLYNFWKRE